jgi:hypothetical protein
VFGLNHLFDNALVGLALMSVLVIFAASVVIAGLSCFRPAIAPKGQNFTYVATAIAGLVLSVASGVLGKPTTVTMAAKPAAPFAAPDQGQASSYQATISDTQVAEYQQLYAWTYVVIGLVTLIIFVLPTPANHDLVKNVALTTLGFLITIVGAVASRPPTTVMKTVATFAPKSVTRIQPKSSVLF